MKKLKIFLLLSILLCFGFILSPEVHAQGDGPKIFEVGDVLPAEIIKMHISLYNSGDFYQPMTKVFFNDTNWISFSGAEDDGYDLTPYVYIYTELSSNYIIVDNSNSDYEGSRDEEMYAEIIIDFSNCSLSERTVTSIEVSSNHGGIDPMWEVVQVGAKKFEIGDILPAGYIKISWDFTDKFNAIFDYDVTFWIDASGDPENTLYIEIEVWDYGEEVRFTINQEEFYIDIPGETVISIPIPYTINQVDANNGYDYYESIGDALMWEVVTEEDFIYDQGYQDGYSDGYFMGYEHARGVYGYYDSTTDEWLTVSEYLNRYGTDKPGQSDFYDNFDKYFIPAMIIVFGGAIVLTILKVFKGRE